MKTSAAQYGKEGPVLNGSASKSLMTRMNGVRAIMVILGGWALSIIISSVDVEIATKTTIKMEPNPLAEGAPMRSITRFFRSVLNTIKIFLILLVLSFTAIAIFLIQAISQNN